MPKFEFMDIHLQSDDDPDATPISQEMIMIIHSCVMAIQTLDGDGEIPCVLASIVLSAVMSTNDPLGNLKRLNEHTERMIPICLEQRRVHFSN